MEVQAKKRILDEVKHTQLSAFSFNSPQITSCYFTEKRTKPSKTISGFYPLDKILNGGFPIGLTVIGGIPGSGKTTLMVQAAVERAILCEPTVFISLDMRATSIIDKIYSQLSFQVLGSERAYPLHEISRDLLQDDEGTQKLLGFAQKMLPILYVVDFYDNESLQHYGPLEDGEIMLERIIRTYCETYNTPLIVIDNLQVLSGWSGDGKVGVDKTLRSLKAYAAAYGAAIVLISTLSRAAYEKPLELSSFKESGNVEFDADALIGIEPVGIAEKELTVDEYKSQAARDVLLKCLKSRDSEYRQEPATLYAPYCTFLMDGVVKKKPKAPEKKGSGKVTFTDE